MQPKFEGLLRLAITMKSIEAVLEKACRPFGEVVTIRIMFTRQEFLPRQITAIVELEQTVAMDIAFAYGVDHLGTRLVVFRYDAPEGFHFRDRKRPAREPVVCAGPPVTQYELNLV